MSGAFDPPPGKKRILTAVVFGLLVHSVFLAAVVAMVAALYTGMTVSLGTVAWPYAGLANAALLLQFPLLHSFLLTRLGSKLLGSLVPGYGGTLGTTTYAIIASIQLLALFLLWTPSGIVWWQAEGKILVLATFAHAVSWLLLAKASLDAGAEVQSGALGWLSLLQDVKPRFPEMPTGGLFSVIRQPIYVAFALTTWTVPVWTPDQLAVALTLTSYCLVAPLMKERRFEIRYGKSFRVYRSSVPYAIPHLTRGERQ
ncbi:MAG: isoprenylcysteine carboxylmethyltransferase family protein [Pseudomonadota bacterium]